ncbi:hypothetical protein [Endozoicomonas sp. 8E]|uniref:hypothetical protein n=1 Tax=Endozoicomonas sp. 8E TaxID=3035692 RepID=UPI00293907BD|nr:hypothetical protein [Endozoicomonas sp. 8E]WOG27047.1 hypothetical protein P6910_21230 [Endozoicomonas sp. 8E]
MLSVVCQAEPWTGRFTVEFGKDAGRPNHGFYIKSDLIKLPDNPSDITDANHFAGSVEKRHRPYGYIIKAAIIESISWQWLYASNLLVAFEIPLITKDNPLSSGPDSWPPLEALVAISWFLKSYWSPDSSVFKPIEQQAASLLTQGDFPFSIIAAMFGSGDNPQQYPPSESSGQRVPAASIQVTGYFTNLLNSGSGDGNGGSQKDSHTLGLDCFVYPCRGVCRYQPSSVSGGLVEWPLKSEESSTSGPVAYTNDTAGSWVYDWVRFDSQPFITSDFEVFNERLDPQCILEEDEMFITLDQSEIQPTTSELFRLDQSQHHPSGTGKLKARADSEQTACNAIIIGEDGKLRPCEKVCSNARALSSHRSKYHTGQKTCQTILVEEDGQQRICGTVCKNARALSFHRDKYHTRQRICDVTGIRKNGQPELCGTVCKNSKALWNHKRKKHFEQKTCELTLVREDGQQQQCGKIFKNAKALSDHKRRIHDGQQRCSETVLGENGQQRSCGTISKNSKALSTHKRRAHTKQVTCDVKLVGKNGKPRLCGKVCINALYLSIHKSKAHGGQRICDATLIGEDGQLQPCGAVCKNPGALSSHKSGHHSGKKTCDLPLIGADGQPQPCGKVCKHAKALTDHKRKEHSRQQTCDATVVGKDGQQKPCGKICKNAYALSGHKRKHQKRKPVNVDESDDLSLQKIK